MRYMCILLSPSVVNCLSVSLAIKLSLLHFICNEDAKKSWLALSPSLHRYKRWSPQWGSSFGTASLGFSVKPPSCRSLSPCSLPVCFARCHPNRMAMDANLSLSVLRFLFPVTPPTCGTYITAGLTQLLPSSWGLPSQVSSRCNIYFLEWLWLDEEAYLWWKNTMKSLKYLITV